MDNPHFPAQPSSPSSPFQNRWTRRYAKCLALILLYGAVMHIGNILGWTGTPWLDTPPLWRGMDIVLLIFNGITAITLWRGLPWSVPLTFGGILLLQFIPYTLGRSHFITNPEDIQTLNGLLGTEAFLLALFALLLWRQK